MAAVEVPRTDRVRVETRVLAAALVPFLLIAFAILYFKPDDTRRLFAWPVTPHMTAYLLGSAYIGGAYFFARAAFERRWHRIEAGFLPVTAFAALMLVSTLIHWTRFSQGSLAFTTWVVLYVVAPVLVPVIWLRNRRVDPGTSEADDVDVPIGVRRFIGACGALTLGTGVLLVAAPRALFTVWPWPLTELTARVIGCCFALVGVFGLTIVRDRRWSASRLALQSQAIGVVAILGGVLRSRDELDSGGASTWIFVIGMLALLVAIGWLYGVLEWRRAHRRSGRASAP